VKKELSTSTIVIVAVVVAALLGVLAYSMLGASGGIGSGAPVQPRKFQPPAGYKMPNQGGPMGAPSAPNSAGGAKGS